MSRISHVFEQLQQHGRRALIPFITSGDPDLATTLDLMHAMAQACADLIELGVPFSDPMADGPTIQRSSERALAQGVGLRDVLAVVAEFRRKDGQTPVVLMGYLNPVERMGYDAFARAARQAGVDGVLTVDCPPEEAGPLTDALYAHAIDPIFLLSPTTPESRFPVVARLARGFIYYVSLKGVTGAATLDVADVRNRIHAMRGRVGLPIGVGFGIRDAQSAQAVARFADAVVVGSRIVQAIEEAPRGEAVDRVAALIREIRSAIDAGVGAQA